MYVKGKLPVIHGYFLPASVFPGMGLAFKKEDDCVKALVAFPDIPSTLSFEEVAQIADFSVGEGIYLDEELHFFPKDDLTALSFKSGHHEVALVVELTYSKAMKPLGVELYFAIFTGKHVKGYDLQVAVRKEEGDLYALYTLAKEVFRDRELSWKQNKLKGSPDSSARRDRRFFSYKMTGLTGNQRGALARRLFKHFAFEASVALGDIAMEHGLPVLYSNQKLTPYNRRYQEFSVEQVVENSYYKKFTPQPLYYSTKPEGAAITMSLAHVACQQPFYRLADLYNLYVVSSFVGGEDFTPHMHIQDIEYLANAGRVRRVDAQVIAQRYFSAQDKDMRDEDVSVLVDLFARGAFMTNKKALRCLAGAIEKRQVKISEVGRLLLSEPFIKKVPVELFTKLLGYLLRGKGDIGSLFATIDELEHVALQEMVSRDETVSPPVWRAHVSLKVGKREATGQQAAVRKKHALLYARVWTLYKLYHKQLVHRAKPFGKDRGPEQQDTYGLNEGLLMGDLLKKMDPDMRTVFSGMSGDITCSIYSRILPRMITKRGKTNEEAALKAFEAVFASLHKVL